MNKVLLSAFFFLFIVTFSQASDIIKIMPVGNSITAGEHYRFPALEERTGYRKALYEMLINTGYNVDFVGSQNHGIRPEDDKDWYDWNCEAYPGWKIPDIADKLKTALEVYKPDTNAIPPYEGGDFWGRLYPGVSYDKYHPNNKGNTKMAVKFYEELIKVLDATAKPAEG